MNPTVLLVLQVLLQYGPAVAQEVQKLIAMKDPTQADWDALFAKAQTPYSTYVPPPAGPGPVPVGP